MRFRIVAKLVLAALASLGAHHVYAQEMFAEPVTEGAAGKALGLSSFASRGAASHSIDLDAVEPELAAKLRAKRAAARPVGTPVQIGFARDIAPSRAHLDLRKLAWEAVDGGMAARFTITSPGAEALRAAFVPNIRPAAGSNRVEMEGVLEALERTLDQVTLRFAGTEEGRVFTVEGIRLQPGELTWSPVVTGDTLTVEIQLGRDIAPELLSISWPQVSHLDIHPAAPTQAIRAKIGESGWCENDILCRSSAPSGFLTAAKAVARMVFTKSGSSYLCTGTLMNNNNVPKKSHFYTANHCIASSTVANTLQTYWFYHAATCNGSTVNSGYRTLTGGSYLRYGNSSRDVSLLELKEAPPSGAIYGGWNAATLPTGTAIEGIHHPAGDVKKYSLGSKTASEYFDGKGPFHKVRWTDGVTEGGSSGSGVFTVTSTGSYQLRGGLYGGTSYCNAQSDPDYYSKLNDVYTSLQPYLNP